MLALNKMNIFQPKGVNKAGVIPSLIVHGVHDGTEWNTLGQAGRKLAHYKAHIVEGNHRQNHMQYCQPNDALALQTALE